ncbi:MAG: hypothetical protein PUD44_04005 [Clostridiaceae bacterium]|nr:hypothetical protein [Clostridiaceae bacterium]
MKKVFQQFLKQNIPLDALGAGYDPDACPYFCTPRGAEIIGQTGSDGIHFCFVRGFGETVFAVSPMNGAGEYVHPIAENFTDFLRLLLACGDAALLEPLHALSREEFDALVRSQTPSEEQRTVLDALRCRLGLSPMEDAFSYVRTLQASFDCAKIRFTEDFYDNDLRPEPWIPEWKVRFGGNFTGLGGEGRAGREIPVGKTFSRGVERFLIPAVTACARGLVVDLCRQTEPDEIRAFMARWFPDGDEAAPADAEQRLRLEAENPLNPDFRLRVLLNGRSLSHTVSFGTVWNPCLPDGVQNDPGARAVLDHYGLDPSCGWSIGRACFSWPGARRPAIRSMTLTLSGTPVCLPGPHFRVSTPGDSVGFTHPLTGVRHTLTVQRYTLQEIPIPASSSSRRTGFCRVLAYTLSPALPASRIQLLDCAESDRMPAGNAPFAPDAAPGAAFAVIGGADGPTALVFGGSAGDSCLTAAGSLHLAPPEHTEWRIVFRETPGEDVTIDLTPFFTA